jgi:hypothetical protein
MEQANTELLLEDLAGRALLYVDKGNNIFWYHPLVREIAWTKIAADSRDRTIDRYAKYIYEMGKRPDAVVPHASIVSQKNNAAKNSIAPKVTRDIIFISYAHRDRKWVDALRTMLGPLLRNKSIELWDDGKIKAGSEWKSDISKALSRARVAVLIFTDSFLDSDFIAEDELPSLLHAAQDDGARIVWFLASDCLYGRTKMRDFQAAIDPGRPLDAMSGPARKKALRKIAEAIDEAFRH